MQQHNDGWPPQWCSHHYNKSCTCKNRCCDDMDTHDEEFGPLIRKQIQADKEAKEKRDNTHAQGGRAFEISKPPSLQWPSDRVVPRRLEYVLSTLETMLRNELIAKQQADEFLDGSEGVQTYYAKSTREAFEESRRLAVERIKQLEISLSFFKQA